MVSCKLVQHGEACYKSGQRIYVVRTDVGYVGARGTTEGIQDVSKNLWLTSGKHCQKEWVYACERIPWALEKIRPEEQGEVAIEEAKRLLQTARHLAGVACQKCAGRGRCGYASTATWHGGVGGQAITVAVCDKCWGTGRTDRTGLDLRILDRRLVEAYERGRKDALQPKA